MKLPVTNPVHWRLSLLLELGPDDVHELACRAVGTLTSYRLVLGRCLLAMHQSKGYKKHGCSSAIHYACAALGMSGPAARECRRVAYRLQDLPELTLVAEAGSVEWSKLREIVRRAVPSTERFWLALANRYSYKEIEELVSRTPYGSVPGEVDTEGDSYRSELRCAASPELCSMLDRVRRLLSVEKEEVATTAEVLEMALASLISTRPFDSEVLERARATADRDLLAEQARRLPLVIEARELALEMGLLEPEVAAGETCEAVRGDTHPECSASDSSGGSATATRPSTSASTQQQCPALDSSARSVACGSDSTAAAGRAFDSSDSGRASTSDFDADFTSALASTLPQPRQECSVRNIPEKSANSESGDDRSPSIITTGISGQSDRSSSDNRWRNDRLRFNPKARQATRAQRVEILRRDGWSCRTPGCPNRVWLHLHHLHEYAQGGETIPENLVCLCSGCHRNVHHGELKISESSDGKLVYTDGEGRPLDRQADIELASWLDHHLGWRGVELDSHQARFWNGEWTIFTS